jgi:uncharacterized protein GlcG (DUF336 family)
MIMPGLPRSAISAVSSRATRLPDIDVSEFRRYGRRRAESGVIQRGEIFARGSASLVLDLIRLPLVARHRTLLIGVRGDQAGVDGEPIGSNQDFGHASAATWLHHQHGQIGKLSQPGGSLFRIEHSNDGLITFPRGLPIIEEEGVLIGAIGVSGSTVENDHAVAHAGVSVVGVSDLPAHPWRT